MIVLDNNIWIHGLTETRPKCTETLKLISYGNDQQCCVSAYIYKEVVENLNRSRAVEQERIDALIGRFIDLMQTSDSIIEPGFEQLRRVDVSAERTHPANVTLATALGIQAKDAPIISFAYTQQRNAQPGEMIEVVEVVTADRPFSRLEPARFELPIALYHVDEFI